LTPPDREGKLLGMYKQKAGTRMPCVSIRPVRGEVLQREDDARSNQRGTLWAGAAPTARIASDKP